MNFINKFLLYIVLLPRFIYSKMDVNIPQLRAILTVKLMMDDRRPSTFQQMRPRKSKSSIKGSTIITIISSLFIGFFFLFCFAVSSDEVTGFSLYFSLYIAMLALSLITDFTSVLIDTRDNYIILPKPVNDRTFLIARLLHIIVYVSKLMLPMTIPGMVYLTISKGLWALVVFVFIITLVTLFAIFVVNAVYIIILKITTPQKFQSIISYIQIAFGIIVYAGSQIVPRLMRNSVATFNINSSKWAIYMPPYWFAGGWKCFYSFLFTSNLAICAALSIIVPLLSIWIVIKYLAPSFNQKLSQINTGNSDSNQAEMNASVNTPAEQTGYPKKRGFIQRLATFFTKDGAERMAYVFAWKITSRSRDFRLKVYPSIGYVFIYPAVLLLNNKRFSLESIRDVEGSGGRLFWLLIFYFPFLIYTIAINQVTFSDKYKAAWIFFITPVKTPGQVISGALKGVLTKFYLPIVLITLIMAISIVGIGVIPNLLLGSCNLLLFCALSAYISLKRLPFSEPQNARQRSGTFIRSLFNMILLTVIGGVHYIIFPYTIPVVLVFMLSAIATWMILDSVRSTSWKKVRTSYES